MNRKHNFGGFGLVKAAVAALVLTAGSASAGQVTINFIELLNEGGIHVGGLDINGNTIDFTKLNSEVFHLSSPVVPSGYPADATLSRIGISQSSPGFLVNILESANGPISDQLHVYRINGNFTVMDFISDSDAFIGDQPFATIVETGELQNVLNYTNDRGDLVSINVQSDLEGVPEATTVYSAGIAALAIAGTHLRRRHAV